MRMELLGENHPDTAYTLYGIGLLHKSKKDFESALETFERVLDIRRAIYQTDTNIPVLDTINGIGTTLNSLERYQEAADKFKVAFDTCLNSFGPDHYRTKGLYISNLLYTLRVYLKDDSQILQLRDDYFDLLSKPYQSEALGSFESNFEFQQKS